MLVERLTVSNRRKEPRVRKKKVKKGCRRTAAADTEGLLAFVGGGGSPAAVAQALGRLVRRAKLDDRTVMMVRDLRAAGVPEAKLAAMAGVHAATVRQVVSGRTWRGLPPGDVLRGVSVLLSLPELLTRREALLVSAALALAGGARDDHAAMYRYRRVGMVSDNLGLNVAYAQPTPARLAPRRPPQLAADALSHPSRWRGGDEGIRPYDAALSKYSWIPLKDSRQRRR